MTENEIRHFLYAKYKNQDGYYYAICLKENDRPIGYIQISGDESHDFGYAFLYKCPYFRPIVVFISIVFFWLDIYA